jgi:hypothetical protein
VKNSTISPLIILKKKVLSKHIYCLMWGWLAKCPPSPHGEIV